MKQITSASNPTIKSLKKLFKSKARGETQTFLAEGLRACTTLMDCGIKLIDCYLTDENKNLAENEFKNCRTTIISPNVAKALSQATTPSGIVCHFAIPQQPQISELSEGIVCDNIQDPGNLGTLIRTCAAMDKKSIVLLRGVDAWSNKVVQASAGAIGYVKIFQLSWQELKKNKGKLNLCALVATDGEKPTKENLCNALFVIGNEANGIEQKIINDCDKKITLCMPGKIESLNAAVAGSIILYLST